MTNRKMIPGSEHAFTFKTLADALLLRNHIIERFERADIEPDAARKCQQLTFVIIGGGLVGVELFGELTAFAKTQTLLLYTQVNRDDVRFVLLQGGEQIMPEIDRKLADYGTSVLRKRRGAEIQTGAKVLAIAPGKVELLGETIEAETVVLAAVSHPLTRLWANCRSTGMDAAASWSMGPYACRAIPKSGPSAIVRPFPPPTTNRIQASPNMPCAAQILARNIRRDYSAAELPSPSLQHLGDDGISWPQPSVRTALQATRPRRNGMASSPHVLPASDAGLAPRRARIMIDWTFAMLFQPDIVKINLDSEDVERLRRADYAETPAGASK